MITERKYFALAGTAMVALVLATVGCAPRPLVCKPRPIIPPVPSAGELGLDRARVVGLAKRDARHRKDPDFPNPEEVQLHIKFNLAGQTCINYGYWQKAAKNFERAYEYSPILETSEGLKRIGREAP